MKNEDYKQGYTDAMNHILADIKKGCNTPKEDQDEMFWADMCSVREAIEKRLSKLK